MRGRRTWGLGCVFLCILSAACALESEGTPIAVDDPNPDQYRHAHDDGTEAMKPPEGAGGHAPIFIALPPPPSAAPGAPPMPPAPGTITVPVPAPPSPQPQTPPGATPPQQPAAPQPT